MIAVVPIKFTPAVGVPALQVDSERAPTAARLWSGGKSEPGRRAGRRLGLLAPALRGPACCHCRSGSGSACRRGRQWPSGAGAAAAGVGHCGAGPPRSLCGASPPGPLPSGTGRWSQSERRGADCNRRCRRRRTGSRHLDGGHGARASPHTHIHTKRAPLVSFEGRSYRLSMIEVGCSEQDKPRVANNRLAMFKLGNAASSLAWPAAKGPSWLTVIRLCAISQASSSVTSVWTLCRLDGFS